MRLSKVFSSKDPASTSAKLGSRKSWAAGQDPAAAMMDLSALEAILASEEMKAPPSPESAPKSPRKSDPSIKRVSRSMSGKKKMNRKSPPRRSDSTGSKDPAMQGIGSLEQKYVQRLSCATLSAEEKAELKKVLQVGNDLNRDLMMKKKLAVRPQKV